MLLQNRVTMRVVDRPVSLLADVDAIERRLGQEHPAAGDQLRHVPEDEREQQRRDVMTVRIGVRENDHLAVPESREIEVLARATAERRYEIRKLLVFEYLRERRALGVEDLAAQRQDGLSCTVATLFGGSSGRVALHDENLAGLVIG